MDEHKCNCTEEELEHYMFDLCDYVPKCHEGMCRAFVSDYGMPVLRVMMRLQHHDDPQAICALADVCPDVPASCRTETPHRYRHRHRNVEPYQPNQ